MSITTLRDLAASPHVATADHAAALTAALEAEAAAIVAAAEDEAAYQAAKAAALALPTRPCSLCIPGEGCDDLC